MALKLTETASLGSDVEEACTPTPGASANKDHHQTTAAVDVTGQQQNPGVNETADENLAKETTATIAKTGQRNAESANLDVDKRVEKQVPEKGNFNRQV